MNFKGRVLVACEFSGCVRDSFSSRGWDAVSVDLIDSETEGNHHIGDIFDFLDNDDSFDLFIAHPPCTYLANSGVRWLYNEDKSINDERWRNMVKASNFFKDLLYYFKDVPTCVENPVIHKHAKNIIGCSYSQTIQPYQFGHGESKRTCFWLRGLPNLVPTELVSGRDQRVWKMAPSENRRKEKSRFFKGVADAMSDQWTEFLYK